MFRHMIRATLVALTLVAFTGTAHAGDRGDRLPHCQGGHVEDKQCVLDTPPDTGPPDTAPPDTAPPTTAPPEVPTVPEVPIVPESPPKVTPPVSLIPPIYARPPVPPMIPVTGFPWLEALTLAGCVLCLAGLVAQAWARRRPWVAPEGKPVVPCTGMFVNGWPILTPIITITYTHTGAKS